MSFRLSPKNIVILSEQKLSSAFKVITSDTKLTLITSTNYMYLLTKHPKGINGVQVILLIVFFLYFMQSASKKSEYLVSGWHKPDIHPHVTRP